MYYVFFETGNDDFFTHIANSFCEQVGQSVINLYESGIFTNCAGMLDYTKMKKYFKTHGNIFCFLNCGLFPNINCNNDKCGTENISALALNQIKILEKSFRDMIMTVCSGKYLRSSRDRLNLQRIFHTYIAGMQQAEEIQVENEQNHDEYLRFYIKKTNTLKEKAEGFIYIRAQTQSDYDYFISNTELPNVTACDIFNL
ncbi:MAG: hypothetical protein FWD26_04560 [Treponema sp.]|nr:hypothetical protein [Treponema sp.]